MPRPCVGACSVSMEKPLPEWDLSIVEGVWSCLRYLSECPTDHLAALLPVALSEGRGLVQRWLTCCTRVDVSLGDDQLWKASDVPGLLVYVLWRGSQVASCRLTVRAAFFTVRGLLEPHRAMGTLGAVMVYQLAGVLEAIVDSLPPAEWASCVGWLMDFVDSVMGAHSGALDGPRLHRRVYSCFYKVPAACIRQGLHLLTDDRVRLLVSWVTKDMQQQRLKNTGQCAEAIAQAIRVLSAVLRSSVLFNLSVMIGDLFTSIQVELMAHLAVVVSTSQPLVCAAGKRGTGGRRGVASKDSSGLQMAKKMWAALLKSSSPWAADMYRSVCVETLAPILNVEPWRSHLVELADAMVARLHVRIDSGWFNLFVASPCQLDRNFLSDPWGAVYGGLCAAQAKALSDAPLDHPDTTSALQRLSSSLHALIGLRNRSIFSHVLDLVVPVLMGLLKGGVHTVAAGSARPLLDTVGACFLVAASGSNMAGVLGRPSHLGEVKDGPCSAQCSKDMEKWTMVLVHSIGAISPSVWHLSTLCVHQAMASLLALVKQGMFLDHLLHADVLHVISVAIAQPSPSWLFLSTLVGLMTQALRLVGGCPPDERVPGLLVLAPAVVKRVLKERHLFVSESWKWSREIVCTRPDRSIEAWRLAASSVRAALLDPVRDLHHLTVVLLSRSGDISAAGTRVHPVLVEAVPLVVELAVAAVLGQMDGDMAGTCVLGSSFSQSPKQEPYRLFLGNVIDTMADFQPYLRAKDVCRLVYVASLTCAPYSLLGLLNRLRNLWREVPFTRDVASSIPCPALDSEMAGLLISGLLCMRRKIVEHGNLGQVSRETVVSMKSLVASASGAVPLCPYDSLDDSVRFNMFTLERMPPTLRDVYAPLLAQLQTRKVRAVHAHVSHDKFQCVVDLFLP